MTNAARRNMRLAFGMFLANFFIWLTFRFLWLDDFSRAEDVWDSQMQLAQALFVLDTLVVVWLYTNAAQEQAGASRDQLQVLREQLITDRDQQRREMVEELKRNKPIVLGERIGARTQIRDHGGGVAVNVWYLVEGQRAIPIGALGPGESRMVPFETADRYLLLAQARPNTGRKWATTINVVAGDTVIHSFAVPTNVGHDGELPAFLADEENVLLQQMRNAHAGT